MRTLPFILILFFLSECSTTPANLSADKYIGWLSEESNGLFKKKTIGEITVFAQYRSPEAMALIRTGNNPTPEEWKTAKEASGNMQYYLVSYRLNKSNQDILKYNLSEESEYFARSNYLAFGIDKDVYVLSGKDSLTCRLHQFTPHYGLSPKADIIFAFDEPDSLKKNNHTLVIEDQLFGLGILRFEFEAEHLQEIPTLQF